MEGNVIHTKKQIAYKEILQLNKSFGVNKKTEIHIHTPASYDYKLYSDKDADYYKKLTDLEMLEIAYKERLFPQEIYISFKSAIEKSHDIDIFLKNNNGIFSNIKEYLSYLLLVDKLYKNNIEIAIISDHNTVAGYKKLKRAIKLYFSPKKDKSRYINLFLGVEISCADRNHVIGIFDYNKLEEVDNYLKTILMSEQDGTYETSLKIMQDIKNDLDGIAYIAHLDTSDIFKMVTGGYKKALFKSNATKYIGLSNYQNKDVIQNKLKQNLDGYKEVKYIQDGDSHAIDEIGNKCIWIKFNTITWNSLKKAFANFNMCIFNEKPKEAEKYIKGMYIFSGRHGFLGKVNSASEGKNPRKFCINFSKDLNCIIGGRGTGKSTILKVLETAFTMKVDNIETLELISRHDMIFIVFHFNNQDYILEFNPQVELYNNNVIFLERYLNYSKDNRKEEINLLNYNNLWRKIYLVKEENDGKIEFIKQDSEKIAEQFFRRGYSINKLVSKIEKRNIDEVLKEIIVFGMKLNEPIDQIDNVFSKIKINQSDIRELSKKILDFEKSRTKLISSKIEGFNKRYEDTIQILYYPNNNLDKYVLDNIFDKDPNYYVKRTIVTWGDLQQLTEKQIESIGFAKYINYLFKDEYDKLEDVCKLESIKSTLTIEDVERGLDDVNEKNIKNIYSEIKRTFFKNKYYLSRTLKQWVNISDTFDLSFNISKKETINNNSEVFRKLNNLSLGQQVAAILTFVLEFGKYIGDDTPLIIDQPEDNLDNQYIFKTLVSALREVKNQRQVLIATHSSTIVTNADAEQVVVLDSNNTSGWIIANGYPSDKKIVNHIINYLEGGKESFQHKVTNYSLVLEDLL